MYYFYEMVGEIRWVYNIINVHTIVMWQYVCGYGMEIACVVMSGSVDEL